MKINVNYATGLVLSKDVYSTERPLLLMAEGRQLDKKSIENLKKHGITEVDVDLTNIPENFIEELESSMLYAISGAKFSEVVTIANTLEQIVPYLEDYTIDTTKYAMTDPKTISPLLLTINSVIPAIKVASCYNKNQKKSDQLPIKDVAIAVMLQDIGYLCSSNAMYLLSINGKFNSEYEKLIQKYPELKPVYLEEYHKEAHPLYSHYIMRGEYISDIAETAVLYHNEMYQNSSNGVLKTNLKEEALEQPIAIKIAMIIKVVDAYNKILYAGKKYNKDYPFEIVPKYLEAFVANGTLSPEFVNILKEVMPLYPVGMNVALSDGTTAKVVAYDKDNMLNPTIADLNGEVIEDTNDLKVAYPLGDIVDFKRSKRL